MTTNDIRARLHELNILLVDSNDPKLIQEEAMLKAQIGEPSIAEELAMELDLI